MSESFERERQVAIQAVRWAMDVCRNVQFAITDEVLQKEDRSPVTIADFASQALICRELDSAFPEDPIIGEEDAASLRTPEQAPFLERIIQELSGIGLSATPEQICGWIDRGCAQGTHERFWTLDPIDGTKGFLRGEQYAISLALLVGGQIQVAVLGCPNLAPDGGQVSRDQSSRGSLFYAVRGAGAWVVSPDNLESPKRIRVRDVQDVTEARVCESVESGHTSQSQSGLMAERLGIQLSPLRMDSQAKYASVARGEAEIYLRLPTRKGYREKIWDHAGGVLLVEEAGGKVTDVRGRELDFTHGDQLKLNEGVIVTNGPLHSAVLAAYEETEKKS
ncbi:MAG: 3'(2'),5'-bisphosphate nucleotidase [Planctomycetaceae bacterium]|nr:3'(2'),5'-bisphosphate nucleotidase [Planctomycetaceae bacterium]